MESSFHLCHTNSESAERAFSQVALMIRRIVLCNLCHLGMISLLLYLILSLCLLNHESDADLRAVLIIGVQSPSQGACPLRGFAGAGPLHHPGRMTAGQTRLRID